MPRRKTPDDHRHELTSLTGEDRLQAAVSIMNDARDLDVVRRAIGAIANAEDVRFHDDLVAKFTWCEEQPHRRDGGGYIRSALVKALRPISGPDDAPLFQRAMLSYEMDGPFEICGELRTAGLVAMNDVNPDTAASFAARFLHDPQMTYSGEPARTAVALLASHGNLAPVYGMVSWGIGRGDVIAEGLRGLTEVSDDLLLLLVDRFIQSEDEQVILGLFELLLGHRTRDAWVYTFEHWFRTTTEMDLYAVIALQIVGSRSPVLIGMLQTLREGEFDPLRQELLDQALTLV